SIMPCTHCRHDGSVAVSMSGQTVHWVRIYSRGDLIKTHPHQKRGGRATDFTDYPDGRAPFAMRWPDFYRTKHVSWAHPWETSPTDSWKVSFRGAVCARLKSYSDWPIVMAPIASMPLVAVAWTSS